MHEYSIIQALLARIEEEAARREARAVTRVRVAIGELSGVEAELLATAYRTFRERTICQTAPLEIVPVAARWACPRCEGAIAKGKALTCAACGVPARLTAGEEIVLERIEMEVA